MKRCDEIHSIQISTVKLQAGVDLSGNNEAKAKDLSDHYPPAEAGGNTGKTWNDNEDSFRKLFIVLPRASARGSMCRA